MRHQKGFTIVELLIVIVVIAILAAITLVTYNGIQNRSNDVLVQNDLGNVAKKVQEFAITTGEYPKGNTDFTQLGLKIVKKTYGNHFNNGSSTFNFVYCWPSASEPNRFALVASGISGKIFAYVNGSVREFPAAIWTGSSMSICSSVGSPIDNANSRDWLYDYGNWKTYLS